MNFIIYSKEHSYGGFAGFWKPNRHGYTSSIFESGIYSEEEAKEIVQEARGEEIAINRLCFPALYFAAAEEFRINNPLCTYYVRQVEEFLASIVDKKNLYIQYEA